MVENFIGFKRRILLIRTFRSVSAAVSVGLFSSGLLLLLYKLGLIGIQTLGIVFIGLGASAAVGGALFFFLRTSDKKLAKLLDERFSLSERVSTMLEYRDEDSPMHEIQRNDANAHLAELSVKAFRPKRLWISLAALLVGAAMMVGAVVYSPPPPEEVVVEEEKFKITELQIKAMNELIANVTASEMASPYRENVVGILKALLETLKTTETAKAKDEAVNIAMKAILSETDESSSAVELIGYLWSVNTDDMQTLAKALCYYDWPALDEWNRFQSLLIDFRTAFTHSEMVGDAPDMDKVCTETEVLLLRGASEISGALVRSKLPEADPLCASLTRLASANEENEDGTRTVYLLQENVTLPADITRGDIIAVLTTGAYNYSMSSNYNRLAKPPVVMIKDGSDYVAVKRESLEDICKNDI